MASNNAINHFTSILLLPTTTSTEGQIQVNNTPAFHAYGNTNIFAGKSAGNFTMTSNDCTGIGQSSLTALTSGGSNTAVGTSSLVALTSGASNTAVGHGALGNTSTDSYNTAIGNQSLLAVNGGNSNISIGFQNLYQLATGIYNIGLGTGTGSSYTTSESSNILMNNTGTAGESNIMRLGAGTGTGTAQLNKSFIHGVFGITTGVTGVPVVVDNAGQFGTVVSSVRYKENIQDMRDISSGLMKLRPVVFTYKADSAKSIRAGLIAEEVFDIMPDLVAHNQEGEIETVKYQDIPVLLLNELQKSVKQIQELSARVVILEQKLSDK